MPKKEKDKILDNLPSWWDKARGSTTVGFVEAVANELDDFIVQMDNLVLSVYIDTAIGVELDDLGAIYKLERNPNESDASYRTRIKNARPAFIGSGTIQGLINAFTNATGLPDSNITILEPAVLKVRAEAVFTESEIDLIDIAKEALQQAKAAGVFLTTAINFHFVNDGVLATDSVFIQISPLVPGYFTIEVSGLDGADIIS